MLNFLEIENFRCFEQFKIEGLAQVNLFGGLNNSGKTALLEAFALATNPHDFLHQSAFINIRNLKESLRDSKENLLYKFDTKRTISLKTNLFSQKFDINYIDLAIQGSVPNLQFKFIYINAKMQSVPTALNLPISFDEAEHKERKTQMLAFLQCIDAKIIDARTFATKAQSIYLRRSVEERWFPMENLGDAAQKVLNYALNIYSLGDDAATEKVLIIDEIENGLHYTVQQNFWEQLFNLAKQFNIQIFAATHSIEMIKAYLNTVKKLGETAISNSCFWQIYRHFKTQQIVARPYDTERLDYAFDKIVLETALNFRGE